MNFHYHKSAKSRGIQGFIICSIFFLMLIGAWIYLTFFIPAGNPGELFGSLMGLFAFVLVPILFYWNYRLLKNPGVWNIAITESEVIWEAPKGVMEESFQVFFSDISHVMCEASGHAEGSDSYYLELVNGKRICLKPTHSGININKFIDTLKKQGVSYILK